MGDEIITHTKVDLKPLIAPSIWAILLVIMLSVAGSCDENGMYQGGNDDTPRYGGPR